MTLYPGRSSSLPNSTLGSRLFAALAVSVAVFLNASASAQTTVATPAITPDGGRYTTVQTVTVTCATAGATIRFTENGVDPTASDPVVANGGLLLVEAPRTLKLRAFFERCDGECGEVS
jgi:hypothetical protein